MLGWARQLCPVSSSCPCPYLCRSTSSARGTRPHQPWWLPKDTLHFSPIYRVYPQPPRMVPTFLHYLEGTAQAGVSSAHQQHEAVTAIGEMPGLGTREGSTAMAQLLRRVTESNALGSASPWCFPGHGTLENISPLVPHPCPTRFPSSPSTQHLPTAHPVPRAGAAPG